MKRCLDLAYRGCGNVATNPMVGSVIVYNDKIIGEGYHEKYGSNHAEVNAIANVNDKGLLSKSTLYVNLEPCAHFGKTPPCSDLIIRCKIPKVVIGCIDIFSEVSGKGIAMMRNANIEVVVGVLEKESRDLNKKFFSFHEKKRPYIILKWARSKDGFIAPHNQSGAFWMTSYQSKKLVHQWRAAEDAILIGRVTAQKDNPTLTVREVAGNNPVRIVIDKELKLRNELNLFNDDATTIIFNAYKSEHSSCLKLIKIDFNNGLLENILHELYKLNIQSVIVEGGAITLKSFINENIWDEARIFTVKNNLFDGVKSPDLRSELIENQKVGNDYLEIIKND